jgi:hypothetical protein
MAAAVDRPAGRTPIEALRPAGMGNLAQSARHGELKSARSIMLVVGVITVALNGFFFFMAESNVKEELDKEVAKLPSGTRVDQAKYAEVRDRAIAVTRMINAGGVVLGAAFLGCAAFVYRQPVPATITSLVLYLGGNAIFGFLEPATLTAGIIVKGLIVVGLFKAVQTAIAYQKELATADGT